MALLLYKKIRLFENLEILAYMTPYSWILRRDDQLRVIPKKKTQECYNCGVKRYLAKKLLKTKD